MLLIGFVVVWGIFMLIVLLGVGNGLIYVFEKLLLVWVLNFIKIYLGWIGKFYDGLKEG